MTQVPLNDVKRMIDIENGLIEISRNNVEINSSNSIEILNSLVELYGDLDIKDIEYTDVAIKLPFREIEMYYNAYLNNKDKIKESQLFEYLKKTYKIDEFYINKRLDQIKRIKNVERLDLYQKVYREDINKNKGGKKW